MFCIYCRAELEENVQFCPRCGRDLRMVSLYAEPAIYHQAAPHNPLVYEPPIQQTMNPDPLPEPQNPVPTPQPVITPGSFVNSTTNIFSDPIPPSYQPPVPSVPPLQPASFVQQTTPYQQPPVPPIPQPPKPPQPPKVNKSKGDGKKPILLTLGIVAAIAVILVIVILLQPFGGGAGGGGSAVFATAVANNPTIQVFPYGNSTVFCPGGAGLYLLKNNSDEAPERITDEDTGYYRVLIGDTLYYTNRMDDPYGEFLFSLSLQDGTITPHTDIPAMSVRYDGEYLYVHSFQSENEIGYCDILTRYDPANLEPLGSYTLKFMNSLTNQLLVMGGKFYYKGESPNVNGDYMLDNFYTAVDWETGERSDVAHGGNYLCGDAENAYYYSYAEKKIYALPHREGAAKAILDTTAISEEYTVYWMSTDGEYVYFRGSDPNDSYSDPTYQYRLNKDGSALYQIPCDGAIQVGSGWVYDHHTASRLENEKVTETIAFPLLGRPGSRTKLEEQLPFVEIPIQ